MRNSNPNNDNLNEGPNPQTAEEYLAYAEGLLGSNGETPAAKRSTSEQPADNSKGLSYTEQVNQLIKEVTVDEGGKFVYPDNTPEHLKYAVAAEKKFRDTQSAFTKTNIELKGSTAEIDALREKLASISAGRLDISQDQIDELEELKFTDPDEWFAKKNKLETDAKNGVQRQLDEHLGEVRQTASANAELERRVEVLNKFNEGRAVPLTGEIFDNDVPPRIGKKLQDGLLTYEGYLSEVDEYLSKGKKVASETPPSTTKLTSGSGTGVKPTEGSQLEADAIDYSKLTF